MSRSGRRSRLAAALVGLAVSPLAPPAPATAQDVCGTPMYGVQTEQVLQPQVVHRFRVENQTEYVEREVTSYRPVTRTEMRTRTYRVARPVTETTEREERYSVLKPVVETSMREEQYQETQMVTETAERQQSVTSYRPVTETSMVQRQYQVQRPVTETSYVDQTYAVNRPVTETVMQNQTVTTMRPVTTNHQRVFDAGGYVPQTSVTPGQLTYQSAYVPRTHAVLGPLGILAYPRGSYAAVPAMTPPTVQTQLAYRPNLVTQNIQQTSLVPETAQVQVPVQVARMQTEYLTQKVPVQQTRMESQVVTERVPVQQTRMVATTEVRRIPYMVSRPVTTTKTRKVPVQQTRYIREEKVRRVPVTTTRMLYETKTEEYPVTLTETEQVVRKELVPVQRSVCVPYEETVMVPTQVTSRVPLSYNDPFQSGIVGGYGSIVSPLDSSVVTSPASSSVYQSGRIVIEEPVVDSAAVVQPAETEVELDAPATYDSTPQTPMRSLRPAGEENLPAPALNGPELDASDEADGLDSATDLDDLGGPAGHRFKWQPNLAREL